MTYAILTCRGLIGLVFAVSAIAKLRSPRAYSEFASWLATVLDTVPVPLAGSRGLPAAFAAAEVAIAAAVAVPVTATAGLALAAAALAALTAGTAVIIGSGARVSCHCFGPSSSPMGTRHLVRDALLFAAAAVGAAASMTGGAGPGSPSGAWLSLAAAVVAATFVVFADDLMFLFGTAKTGRKASYE